MLQSPQKRLNALAILTFVISLVLYFDTMAPTASFWDAGEFIAVANGLQVTHPPGAPLYLLLGRLFSMFAPPMYVAAFVNFLSVVASAITIMLLFLIIVRFVEEWKETGDGTETDEFSKLAGAFVGAMTFMVTDTFWFNAVEAEVYALSMFFTSIIVWLSMHWSKVHNEPRNERFLVLIAYMLGLALGVHLLGLLAIFFVGLIVYFKKFKFTMVSFLGAGVVSSLAFLAIYPTVITKFPEWADNLDRSTVGLINPGIFTLVIIFAVVLGIWYTHKNKYKIANMAFVAFATVLIGYSSYAVVFVRSIANPPIDENDPETTESFVKYLKREQYGNTPILLGNTYNNESKNIERKEVLFPRRWSSQGNHIQKYAEYSSDMDYFWNYQLNHMYWRYFAWNFVGRESDFQDTGVYAGFGENRYKDNPANNPYFYIPFLIGLFGLIFHVNRDWKHALSVFALFILTGLAIVVYLNQYPYQPRERDYAYVGSFFAFAIWVGIGATAILELTKKALKKQEFQYGVLALMLLASPLWMGYVNYHDHDRSERYVAPDYAYNLLNSCAPNAILFTNGDNDTFPLWYAQEVEGIRTDVRIVCLSLLNTPWYIKQLKNQWSHDSEPLPFSMSDEKIDRIEDKYNFRNESDFWKPKTVSIPVDKEALKKEFYSETGLTNEQAFDIPVDSLDDVVSFKVDGQFLGQRGEERLYYTRVQDDAILDLLQTNGWKRPIYFANTVSYDSQLNLQSYFKVEGQAFRIVPKKGGSNFFGNMTASTHAKRMSQFRFRELDNPKAYFDESIRGMFDNYRITYTTLADTYIKEGKADSAVYWLNKSREVLPFETLKDDDGSSITRFAMSYIKAKRPDLAYEFMKPYLSVLKEDFKSRWDDFEAAVSRAEDLEAQINEARRNAELTKVRELRNKLDSYTSSIEAYKRQVQMIFTNVIVMQHVLFQADKIEEEAVFAKFIEETSGPQVGYPKSKQQNYDQINQIFN